MGQPGPANGLALLAAVGAGAFKHVGEARSATIRVVSAVTPNRMAKKVYDRAFPIYRGLYRSLKEDFKCIAGLEG